MTTATQSEFADLLGKDKSYVTRLKQAGRLVITAEGLVDATTTCAGGGQRSIMAFLSILC